MADTFPELAIVGAARSGTSFLAAHLADHPHIDAPAVKEPNFFSRHFDKGLDWFDGYFPPRVNGNIRMDASTSYTFPHFPDALPRLAATSPDALIVYVVRDPLERAYSHYRHNRHYFQTEQADDLGTALRQTPVFLGASDYTHWLDRLGELFPAERILVVPFAMIEAASAEVSSVVCEQAGLGRWDSQPHETAWAHRNGVVSFRNGAIRVLADRLRRSSVYPPIRRAIGPGRVRKIRSLLTKQAEPASLTDELTTCAADQLASIHQLNARARQSVDTWLAAQDSRLGLNWGRYWSDPQLN